MKKQNVKLKKFLKIAGTIILISIVIILYISYAIDYNQNLSIKTKKEISQKYPTEEINYINSYGKYYIIKTKNQVIVLSQDYQEIIKEDLSKLKENTDNLDIIYKTNKLMYEKTIIEQKKVTYEYYNALTGEKIKSTALELR